MWFCGPPLPCVLFASFDSQDGYWSGFPAQALQDRRKVQGASIRLDLLVVLVVKWCSLLGMRQVAVAVVVVVVVVVPVPVPAPSSSSCSCSYCRHPHKLISSLLLKLPQ